jgi:hypothetical protein
LVNNILGAIKALDKASMSSYIESISRYGGYSKYNRILSKFDNPDWEKIGGEAYSKLTNGGKPWASTKKLWGQKLKKDWEQNKVSIKSDFKTRLIQYDAGAVDRRGIQRALQSYLSKKGMITKDIKYSYGEPSYDLYSSTNHSNFIKSGFKVDYKADKSKMRSPASLSNLKNKGVYTVDVKVDLLSGETLNFKVLDKNEMFKPVFVEVK